MSQKSAACRKKAACAGRECSAVIKKNNVGTDGKSFNGKMVNEKFSDVKKVKRRGKSFQRQNGQRKVQRRQKGQTTRKIFQDGIGSVVENDVTDITSKNSKGGKEA